LIQSIDFSRVKQSKPHWIGNLERETPKFV
jgi:hypothetical protein